LEDTLAEHQAGKQKNDNGMKETVVAVNRVAKVVKGGKRFSFSALVVIGDGAGKVGCGLGKANEVQSAIQKGTAQANKSLISVCLKDSTIPHEIIGISGAGKVFLKPAAPGTGVIAGGSVRAVLEAVGIKDILSKSMRSSNPFNVVYATLNALSSLRSKEEIAKIRNKEVADI
jgi:small subunit ribosomal protein S5